MLALDAAVADQHKSNATDESLHPAAAEAFGKILHPKKRAYLIALSVSPNLDVAAKLAGISSMTGYLWRNSSKPEDEEFLNAVALAREIAIERAENEAWRRAIDGVEEEVHGSLGSDPNTGKSLGTGVVGVKKSYSDVLMMFMLKGHRPEKYRERFEHSGPNGGPMQVQAVDPRMLSTDTLQRILEEAKQQPALLEAAAVEAEVTDVTED
jgi:hypothetical protein